MKTIKLSTILLLSVGHFKAQSPAISSWLQNNVATGTYYPNGNSTAQPNNILVNCQSVQYTSSNVYILTKGIPAYPTGPFQDGNPSQASNQNAIFKFPLAPVQNTGTPVATALGNIAVFINGVAAFDSKDGVSWKSSTNAWAGGPSGGTGDNVWQRDAIVYEKLGFDCSKGHPAMGNYHHHQNPSAFKYDLNVISTVCNPYDANGLYVINTSQHSPLIGFAYDGFPIYGAYGYLNTNGTGGIVRMKSGYQLRNITTRNTVNGVTVTAGPPINSTYPLGSCIQDYEWVANSGPDYLDIHNGRFCVTPEYPAGTYCYFATVDANHNSAYPYLIGPTYYGVYANRKVTSITEPTTTYTTAVSISEKEFNSINTTIYPNPASDMVLIQADGLLKYDLNLELIDISGKVLMQTTLLKGSTIGYFDTQTLYNGIYFIKLKNGKLSSTKKVVIQH
ncbi:MAG: YHYH protein [Bacteroidota bacterium]